MPARAPTAIEVKPVPLAKKAAVSAPVVPAIAPAAPAVQDRRSISPRTVPAVIAPQPQQPAAPIVMPMSMAPTAPASAAAVLQAANEAYNAPPATANTATSAPMAFVPSFDWNMAMPVRRSDEQQSEHTLRRPQQQQQQQSYAGMEALAFNPFAFVDPAAFASFGQPAQAGLMPNAAQFWANYAISRQAAH